MPKILLTKKQIIKAIKTEAGLYPLRHYIVKIDWPNPKTCQVCAVGAVMHQSIQAPKKLIQLSNAINRAGQASLDGGFECAPVSYARMSHREVTAQAAYYVADKAYMNALSYAFEGFAQIVTRGGKNLTPARLQRVREQTVAFVAKYFPAQIAVDINGQRPMKGIPVVKEKKEKES
jgi:hypothetical protein